MFARGSRDDLLRIPRVLVADDDALLRGLIVEVLREECDVIEAIDGADALEKTADLYLATQRFPDAFILDVRMPYLSGINVMCALRGCDRYVPIVLTTAHEDLSTHELATRFGAVLVEKPFDIRALCGAVIQVSRDPVPAMPSRPYKTRFPRPLRPATS
jgi:two-component system nitrogen regulation response regulator GlnG